MSHKIPGYTVSTFLREGLSLQTIQSSVTVETLQCPNSTNNSKITKTGEFSNHIFESTISIIETGFRELC